MSDTCVQQFTFMINFSSTDSEESHCVMYFCILHFHLPQVTLLQKAEEEKAQKHRLQLISSNKHAAVLREIESK